MKEKTARKPGAPKGNRNSLKHGFYSKVYREAERPDFIDAAGIEGIDEEIALLRLEIKKAISGGDERNLLLLIKAAGALEKLIRTRFQIASSQRTGLKEGIGNIIREVLLPLGADVAGAVLTRKISG
jgi:hypothetical protein